MKFKIDNRESNYIFNGFKLENIEYDKCQLEIGDIQYGNVCIEHKTVEDLITSFQKGHVQKQLLQQEQNFEHSILIISGDFKRLLLNKYLRKYTTFEYVSGILSSLTMRYPKTKIVQTYPIATAFNKSENKVLARLCEKLILKGNDNKKITIYDTELLRNTITTDDLKLKVLVSFRGVGLKKAKKLLENEEIKDTVSKLINLVKK